MSNTASIINGMKIENPNETAVIGINHHGFALSQMSNSAPDNSGISIKPIDADAIIIFFA